MIRAISGVAKKVVNELGERIDRHENFVATFETPQGQKVLHYLMKIGHVLEPSYVQGDPHLTSFREGQRHLVLTILRAVNKDTTALIKQIEESAQHENQ